MKTTEEILPIINEAIEELKSFMYTEDYFRDYDTNLDNYLSDRLVYLHMFRKVITGEIKSLKIGLKNG